MREATGVISKKQGVERLGQVPLFSGLSKRDLGRVWDAMNVAKHQTDHQIVVEGQKGLGFHLILSGRVRVTDSSGRSLELGPGDSFGEMALIDDGPRSATVTAITPTETAVIVASNFKNLAKRNPDLMWKLLVQMTERVRESRSAAQMTS